MSRGSGYVEVWGEGGIWHWTYRDPEEGVVLLGNRTYPTRAGAVAAARTAYRSVPIREPAPPRDNLAARTLAATALGALGTGAALGLRSRSGRPEPEEEPAPRRPARRRPGRPPRDA